MTTFPPPPGSPGPTGQLPSRRAVLAALAGMAGWASVPGLSASAQSQTAASSRPMVPLTLNARIIGGRPGGASPPELALWRFVADQAPPGAAESPLAPPILRVPAGEPRTLRLANMLPIPLGMVLRGLDRTAINGAVDATFGAATPLIVQPGGSREFALPPLRAGTYLIQATSGAAPDLPARMPLPCAVLIADEAGAPDAPAGDAVLVIEEWRHAPNGTPLRPGAHLAGLTLPDTVYWANGRSGSALKVPPNAPLRLRLVHAGPRAPIALHFAGYDARVVAIDSAPAEPFLARDSRIILSPGGRMDVEVTPHESGQMASPVTLFDGRQRVAIAHLESAAASPSATPRPAPLKADNWGLPQAVNLTGAQRVALAFADIAAAGTASTGASASAFAVLDDGASIDGAPHARAAPAFRARRGETISLALTSRAPWPATFQLDGHHFRLLDALDDGWKPFWLDTLTIEAGHTARMAFTPQAAGRYALILQPLDWKAAAQIAWFDVV